MEVRMGIVILLIIEENKFYWIYLFLIVDIKLMFFFQNLDLI